jgi:hypothetical protein
LLKYSCLSLAKLESPQSARSAGSGGEQRTRSFDRGRAKTQRNFANNRAERNYSRFFRFQAIWGLEKANKIGPCENALEFSHSLDPKATFKIGPVNGREGRESGLSAEGAGRWSAAKAEMFVGVDEGLGHVR